MDLTRYTSYETSVALRDAGMDPHGLPGKHSWWWRNDVMKYPLLEALDVPFQSAVRSWRLDELIEALAKTGVVRLLLSESVEESWRCFSDLVGVDGDEYAGEADSAVEAAAACLLAVLRSRA